MAMPAACRKELGHVQAVAFSGLLDFPQLQAKSQTIMRVDRLIVF